MMKPQGIRRSDRVTVKLPIKVSGIDASGEDFFDAAETVRLSRFGGSLLIRRKLVPEQELTLRNLQNGREAEIRVIGQISSGDTAEVYGFSFTREDTNPWDIEFPSPEASPNAASRVVMECAACRVRELVYLNEVETEVFLSSQALRRNCGRCRESTVWRESSGASPEPASQPQRVAPVPPEAPPPIPQEAPPGKAMPLADEIGTHAEHHEDDVQAEPRSANERKHMRSRLEITVCIRRHREKKDEWGADEEVIATADVSKGGFGFTSEVRYKKGAQVEVAIPYKAGAANIFVPARIANVRILKSGSRRYGVAYTARLEPSP